MKLTIESTDTIVHVDGVTCRVWLVDGKPEAMLLVHRVLVDLAADQAPFVAELQSAPPARAIEVRQEPFRAGPPVCS